MGVRCMMLPGDAEAVARTVAEELGLDDYFAIGHTVEDLLDLAEHGILGAHTTAAMESISSTCGG